MRIAEVIGRVTLSRCHPSLDAATWRIVVPLSQAGAGTLRSRGEPLIAYDEFGSSQGDRLAVSEGAEASAPFYPNQKPIDAYNAAILDTIDLPNETNDS